MNKRLCRWFAVSVFLIALCSKSGMSGQREIEEFGYSRNSISSDIPVFLIRYVAQNAPVSAGYTNQFKPHESRENFSKYMFSSDSNIDSINNFFQEISSGKVAIVPAARGVSDEVYFVEHAARSGLSDREWESQVREDLVIAADNEINYSNFDRNNDAVIDSSELAIVIVGASAGMSGTVRPLKTVCRGQNRGLRLDGVRLCIKPAAFGSANFAVKSGNSTLPNNRGLAVVAHEIIHTIQSNYLDRVGTGLADLYGRNRNLNKLSLMGAISDLIHLDPVHAMRFGWLKPDLKSINTANYGCQALSKSPSVYENTSPALVLYENNKATSEFVVVESRNSSPTNNISFDRLPAALGTQGLAVWLTGLQSDGKVRSLGSNRAFVSTQSPPNNQLDTNSSLWGSHHSPFSILWKNGLDLGYEFYTKETQIGRHLLYWQKKFSSKPLFESPSIRHCYEEVTGESLATFPEGDKARVYTVNRSNEVEWYKHAGRSNGLRRWANSGEAKVVSAKGSVDLGQFSSILRAENGVVYGVDAGPVGHLHWFSHEDWKEAEREMWPSKTRVVSRSSGLGWRSYEKVFYGDNGVLYAVTPEGRLAWYKHLGWKDGSRDWANSGNELIVSVGSQPDWRKYRHVFSAGDGVIYAVTGGSTGDLHWYKHEGWQDGINSWANGGRPSVISTSQGLGWGSYKYLESGGKGVLYAVKSNGALVWYNHLGYQDGSIHWANRGSEKVISSANSDWDDRKAFFVMRE
ncbi:MAG: tachylectin-related carbohydrate-binding protein [Granulosicoccaceae bacterium]